VVGHVDSLQAWQRDPGKYVNGGFYVFGEMKQLDDGHQFWVGGSFVYITGWLQDHPDYYLDDETMRVFDDRQLVRDMAETQGGAAW